MNSKTSPTDLPMTQENVMYEVVYDVNHGCWPLTCSWCCVAFWSIIGIPFMPCIPCCAKVYLQSQKTYITDRYLKHRSGFITIEDRSIPLDKIQDMKIVSGICDRCFGVSSLQVQTAGSSDPNGGAEGNLYAPVDPPRIREIVLAQRDKLASSGGNNTSVIIPNYPSSGVSTEAMVHELREIKTSVKHIEEIFVKKEDEKK